MNLPTRTLTTLLSLFTAAALSAGAKAHAQAAGALPAPIDGSVEKLDQFVVTGSYIPTNETAFTAGISPVVRIDQRVIEESGFTTTAELLQRLTVSNGGSVPISNNAAGFTPAATSVSLRGLGSEATLVLLNGRRVAAYPVGSRTTAFVDLNSIPLSAVESIEVLKDGASAIYGADAVAGVVNVKLPRGLDGSLIKVTYGNTTNKDASELSAVAITGVHKDRFSALVGVNVYKRNAIFNSDRSYSAVPPFLSTNSSPLNLQITRQAALAAGVPANQLPAGSSTAIFAAAPASTDNQGATPATGFTYSTGRSSMFNVNEFSMSYPNRENRGLFGYFDRKIFGTDHIRGYIDIIYQHAETGNQLAPLATGNFSGTGTELVIPARTPSPLPLADGRARAAAAGAFNPFNPFNIDITGGTRARLVEFGDRILRNTTDATLLTAGIKADSIAARWNFDAGYSYSSIKDTGRNTLVSASRFNRLLDANDPFFQPGSAEFLGTTEPYNPFGYHEVSLPNNARIVPAALIHTRDVNASRLHQVNLVASTGRLLDLPAGPVGFAMGADFRHEQIAQSPDPQGTTGDLIGGSPNAVTRGHSRVWGAFAEGSIPVLRHLAGAHDVSATAAVRHERFMTHGDATTVPKIGLRWQPMDESLTLRASWSGGFRQPSLYELFSTPAAGRTPIQHPLTGATDPEEDVTVAGNRRLDPERTKYLNAGILWSPQFAALKGLTIGVDTWQADRRGTVATHYQDTVNRFFGRTASGAPAPGGLLPGESVALFPDGSIRAVNSVFFNIGRTNVAGFDYSLSYLARTDRLGRFEFSTVWSQYSHYRIRLANGGSFVEVVNQATPDGTGSDNGYLRWKGRAQIAWSHRGFAALLGGHFTDGFWDVDLTGENYFISPTWIGDAQVSYIFQKRFMPWLSDTKIAIGARNILDQDPPHAAGFGANPTGYPGFLYNSEGRFVYLSLTRKF